MSILLEELRMLTYLNCENCKTNKMEYWFGNNEYVYKNCYKKKKINEIKSEDVCFYLHKIKKFILTYKNSKKALDVFLTQVLLKKYTNDEIDEILNKLQTSNVLFDD